MLVQLLGIQPIRDSSNHQTITCIINHQIIKSFYYASYHPTISRNNNQQTQVLTIQFLNLYKQFMKNMFRRQPMYFHKSCSHNSHLLRQNTSSVCLRDAQITLQIESLNFYPTIDKAFNSTKLSTKFQQIGLVLDLQTFS